MSKNIRVAVPDVFESKTTALLGREPVERRGKTKGLGACIYRATEEEVERMREIIQYVDVLKEEE